MCSSNSDCAEGDQCAEVLVGTKLCYNCVAKAQDENTMKCNAESPHAYLLHGLKKTNYLSIRYTMQD